MSFTLERIYHGCLVVSQHDGADSESHVVIGRSGDGAEVGSFETLSAAIIAAKQLNPPPAPESFVEPDDIENIHH